MTRTSLALSILLIANCVQPTPNHEEQHSRRRKPVDSTLQPRHDSTTDSKTNPRVRERPRTVRAGTEKNTPELLELGPLAPADTELAGGDPTKSPAGQEIARLRSSVDESSLARLNAALFFLVRHYDTDELFTLLVGKPAKWVIDRAEKAEFGDKVRRARLAIELHYGAPSAADDATRGKTAREIIELAHALE